MSLNYDEERFEPECSNCGSSDFKRTRVVHEVEILDVSSSGIIHVEDSDMHEQDSWTFECDRCGNTGDDIEDILTERDDEEGDDDDS